MSEAALDPNKTITIRVIKANIPEVPTGIKEVKLENDCTFADLLNTLRAEDEIPELHSTADTIREYRFKHITGNGQGRPIRNLGQTFLQAGVNDGDELKLFVHEEMA